MAQQDNLHKLNTEWVYWFESNKSETSSSMISYGKEMKTVGTVEEFWGFFEDFPNITNVIKGSDNHFFRKGILPTKTDEKNKNGSRFQFYINTSTEEEENSIEELWEKLLCYCIGEIFNKSDIVNGVSISISSKAKVSVWLSASEKDDIDKFIEDFKNDFPVTSAIQFKVFNHKLGSKPYDI